MKRSTFSVFLVLIIMSAFAQTPELFNYQAVVRNSAGDLITNQNIGFRLSILFASTTGTSVYTETQTILSNEYGVCSLKIGGGNVVSGNISTIDWSAGDYFLKVEIDQAGGTNYTPVGTSQMVSVPYAMHAKTASIANAAITAGALDNDIFYFTDSDTLFAVKDRDGNIVFAVFNDGVKVYVNEGVKGSVGGFAVSGRSPGKAIEYDVFNVTPDSARFYVNESVKGKGNVGSFAVSGRSPGKTIGKEYLWVTADSTRIYIEQPAKGKVGGFAVSGRSPAKEGESPFLDITPENYFIGHESGQKTLDYGTASDHGKYNIFLGYQSGMENISGLKNVFIGYKTALANTHGMTNVYIGSESGYNNTLGYDNVFIGSSSGYSNTEGINNVFLGSRSGYTNNLGQDNVFVGFESGYNNEDGIMNTFIGNKAGRANIDGNDNIFIGELAGYLNESGSENIFIGKRAGHMTLNSEENTFIGSYSGQQTTEGTGNTFLGHRTGLGNTKGSQNTYIGALAVNRDSTGNNNVALGFNSGGWSRGSNNVYLGVGAGFNTLGDNNVFIGYNAGMNDSISNCLYIANTPHDSTLVLVYGKFNENWMRINNKLGIGRKPETFALEVEGDAYKTNGTTAWNTPSDRRIKTDIQDVENAFETVLKLRPVKYKFTDDWRKKHPEIKDQYYYNFIAQEYQQVFPESVQGSGEYIEGDKDEILIMNSQNAEIVTIKAVQELIKENSELKERIEKLEEMVNQMIDKK